MRIVECEITSSVVLPDNAFAAFADICRDTPIVRRSDTCAAIGGDGGNTLVVQRFAAFLNDGSIFAVSAKVGRDVCLDIHLHIRVDVLELGKRPPTKPSKYSRPT